MEVLKLFPASSLISRGIYQRGRLPRSSSLEQLHHNTRAPCSFIRCLNKELIITVKLALYECSGTHRVLDKQMNHQQLDLGAPATKSTREPAEMFIFMRS